jgi:uncharacterized membrane protein YfcA
VGNIAVLIAGGLCVLLGLFVAIPVAVNLPESWFGGALAIALLAVGVALIYGSVQNRKALQRSAPGSTKDAF